MTVKELKTMIDALAKYDDTVNINFSVVIEDPLDENSYQDCFKLSAITECEDDVFDWDCPHIFLEFQKDEDKTMMRKALDKYLNETRS